MQAVSIFASKRPFLVPIARVLTKSSARSTEIYIRMLIFPTAYTSFCCFKCKRSSATPPSSKENSDFWGQSQKYVAIGSAQCRHRPAGGQPGRDVAARTAGAEHPTTVFVGCGACKIEVLNVHTSDRLTSLSQGTTLVTKSRTRHKAPNSAQSTALGIYAGRVLKARCASYAQKAPAHYKGPLDHLFIVRYTCFMPSN